MTSGPTEALSVPERGFIVRRALDAAPIQIEYVMMECELRATPTFENMLHARIRFFSSYEYVQSRLDTKFYSNRTLTQRYGPSAFIIAALITNNLNLGVGADLLLPDVNTIGDDGVESHHDEFGWQLNKERQLHRNPARINVALQRASTNDGGEKSRKLTRKEGAAILRDIDFVIQQGSTPIVVFPPVTSGVHEDYAIQDFIAENRQGVIQLDFTPRSADWNLFTRSDCWLDANHLDEKGAGIFSKAVGERLADAINKRRTEAANQ